MTCSILEFGAKPDGKTCNTEAIQNAIDHVASFGGGTALFAASLLWWLLGVDK